MHIIKERVFGNEGFSSDLKLSIEELSVFRQLIEAHWLNTIKMKYPLLYQEAKNIGIENYHLLSDRLDHEKAWPKKHRLLNPTAVHEIKQLPFFKVLKKVFGPFQISDVYDTQQHYGKEEIYWRLVRPFQRSDVGPLHKDKWFHKAVNGGKGMFPKEVTTIKLWIPVYCVANKSGLKIAKNSHKKKFKYHIEMFEGVGRPVLDEDDCNLAAVIPTNPGEILIFNESVLHGGVYNISNKTRISAEITLVIPKVNSEIYNIDSEACHVS